MRSALLAVALLVATPAVAEPAGARGFEVSGVVPAPPAEVFAAFTTPQGWKRMGVPFAAVDFRLGGTIETNYEATAHVGQADNIKNQIVAFIPGRMLALRNVQAPPDFPLSEGVRGNGDGLRVPARRRAFDPSLRDRRRLRRGPGL